MVTEKLGMIGNIHVPELAQLSGKTSCVCEVMAAGKDCTEVKRGDRVKVSVYDKKAAATEIEHEGKKYLLMRERDIDALCTD